MSFRAKSGVRQSTEIHDRLLVRRVRQCPELPGQTLFQYRDDDGAVRRIDSTDVNGYLRDIAGNGFTAKDFRTWVGTLEAWRALAAAEVPGDVSAAARKRQISCAIDHVSRRLGNTRAVCRRSYIHPAILEKYLRGEPLTSTAVPTRPAGLTEDERRLTALLASHR